MPLWRREKPLHERLADEGGTTGYEPHDTRPRWGEVGIHGVHRQREWDVVTTARADGLGGERTTSTALPDGTLLVDDVPDNAVAPLAEAVELTVEPPYRAEATRHDGDLWGVAARQIEVVELEEEVDGEEIELVVRDGERALHVDRRPSFGSLRTLERLAERRFEEYVLRASHLDGRLWEVEIAPL